MRLIIDVLKVSPDDDLTGNSGIVHKRYFLTCAFLFFLVWPVVGAMSALFAAPGFAVVLMVVVELLCSDAQSRRWKDADWLAKSTLFAGSLLIGVPGVVFFSLSTLTSSYRTEGTETWIKLGWLYFVAPTVIKWSLIGIRETRNLRK